MVPMKFNRTFASLVNFESPVQLGYIQAMTETAHGLFVSNTCCNSNPTMASCTTHRKAEVTSELPTPRLSDVETTALKMMNENPRPTFAHVRWEETSVGGPSIEASACANDF